MIAIEAFSDFGVCANDFSGKTEHDKVCLRQRHERERGIIIGNVKAHPTGALELRE